MRQFEIRIIITGSLFLLAVALGYIVRAMGRPLNIMISTFHKLVSFASATPSSSPRPTSWPRFCNTFLILG